MSPLQNSYQRQNHLLKLFKILANANRLKIIMALKMFGDKGATVSELVNITGVRENNLSNHLKLMRIAKVVKAKQENNFMRYFIKEALLNSLTAYID